MILEIHCWRRIQSPISSILHLSEFMAKLRPLNIAGLTAAVDALPTPASELVAGLIIAGVRKPAQ
jgi:hypothetical protein